VPKGTSLMRAAIDAGIQVPKLCATDSLEPFGSCRLCLVEIEGRKGFPASCTTPAEAGMKVRTQTPKLQELRKGVMELYISDHPLDCLTCGANGNCELQDMAGVTGLREVRYGFDGANHTKTSPRRTNPTPTSPTTRAKCIVCNRCVRACEETQGTFALTISGRGFESRVSPGQDQPFMERMRQLRRLRRGLPDRHAAGEDGDPARPARAQRHHHLRLLRRGLRLQGRDEGQRGRAHGALEGRQGQRRPRLRQGPLRLGLRHAQGPHHPPMIRAKITDPWRR
jgi:ferredoxin